MLRLKSHKSKTFLKSWVAIALKIIEVLIVHLEENYINY